MIDITEEKLNKLTKIKLVDLVLSQDEVLSMLKEELDDIKESHSRQNDEITSWRNDTHALEEDNDKMLDRNIHYLKVIKHLKKIVNMYI